MEALSLSGTVGGRGRRWPLEGPCISLGRGRENLIRIAEATVSERHAEIRWEGESWVLRDLGSRNGTRLNGRPVNGRSKLAPGDSIEFGRVALQVTEETSESWAQLSDSTDLAATLAIPASGVLERRVQSPATAAPRLVDALAEAGRLLVQRRPLPDTYDRFLGTVSQAIPASRLVLLLQAGPGAIPMQVAARLRGDRASEPLALSRAIMGSVLDECTSVITTDAGADSRFEDRPSVIRLGIHSAMAVPLFDNERVLGLLYADQDDPTVVYERDQLEVLTLFANMLAVKITNERLEEAEARNIRLEHELSMASRIQRCLLPAECPTLPGYRFHAFLEQCEAVGGDLYDFHPMADGTIYFTLGDVAGKGICAAILMSAFMASIHVLYDSCENLGDLATRLNASISRRDDASRFVTAFLGRLDPATGSIEYVNAGHVSPLLVDGLTVRELKSTGFPLGVRPDSVYSAETVELTRGSLLAVLSDGIPDSRRGEEFLGEAMLTRRIEDAVTTSNLEDLGRVILRDVDFFLDGHPRTDDLTLLLIQRTEGRVP